MIKVSKAITCMMAIIFLISMVSAISIKSLDVDNLTPGSEGKIRVEIENTLQDDVDEVSFNLNLVNLPFRVIGSSEDSIDELNEGEEDDFIFTIKAANDIKPGDYQIPYTISFLDNNQQKQRSGSIGLTVNGNTELTLSIQTEKPIVNKQDKVTLKIVNKGFADAKFVSIKIIPQGLVILSENEAYIGTISSDDFETETFDVIYKTQNPIMTIVVEYKNFDNTLITENFNLPILAYNEEKALELGLITKSNTPLYASILIFLILAFIVIRSFRKRARLKKTQAK
ncbi:MAG: hypothetical protein AABX83_01715 [Nanoarchaeota archaeon]